MRELIVGTPKLLLSAVYTGLVPRMEFLFHELEFSLEELRAVYQKNAMLLLYSVDANLREKIVFFFILQLQMGPERVRRVLLAYPQVLDYNLEDHLRPIAEFYISELKLFSPYEFGSVVRKFPRIFTYSLHRHRHLTGFLQYELALDPQQSKRILFQAPQVLGLSSSTLSQKLAFLRDRLELTAGELGLIFSKMPTLMNLGLSNVAAKVDYLERAISEDQSHLDGKLLKETIMKQPTLLGYSLTGRIQLRMDRLVAAGLDPSKITVGISMTEVNFQRWLTSSQSKKTPRPVRQEKRPAPRRSMTPSKISYLKREAGWSDVKVSAFLSDIGSPKNVASEKLYKQKLQSTLHTTDTTEEVIDKLAMSDNDFETYLVLETLQKLLNFTQKEIDCISDSIVCGSRGIVWRNTTITLASRIDYLLTQGSKDDVKNAIMSRPRLLSYPLEKLRAMSGVLSVRRSTYHPWRFEDESRAVLREVLELTEENVSTIVSGSHYLSLRDPEDFLVPKLNYILSAFDGDRQQAAAAVLENPRLLDYPLELLKEASLDPIQINDVMRISPQKIHERWELQTRLNLSHIELEQLVPLKDWLVHRSLRQSAGPIIEYLSSQLDGSVSELRQIVFEEPKLLTLSLSKVIQPRMDMLSAFECPPADIGRIAILSKQRAENYCAKCWLCKKLDLSSSQMDHVFGSGSNRWESASVTIEKVDHLLHSVFGGSTSKLKEAIVEQPALLTKSLTRTIRPRAELLHFLEAVGLEYSPTDLPGFFVQPDSTLAGALLPHAKNWHPPASSELNKTSEVRDSTSDEDDILTTLSDFGLPSATFVHADEANRDSARVVYWN